MIKTKRRSHFNCGRWSSYLSQLDYDNADEDRRELSGLGLTSACKETKMNAARLITVLYLGFLAAGLTSQALAQPDTQAPPPLPHRPLPEHRIAALKKCTDGIKFATDKYVNCMTAEGEEP
jgi:hypothetical protein